MESGYKWRYRPTSDSGATRFRKLNFEQYRPTSENEAKKFLTLNIE